MTHLHIRTSGRGGAPGRHARLALTVAASALLVVAGAGPALAHAGQPTRFAEVDQVSDQTGKANVTDPNLVNAWGLALSPTSPLWVANNGTNTSTLYAGGVGGAAVTKAPLTVTVPGGAPTGQVFSGGTDFVVTGPGGSGPARFLFASEGGDITGWNPTANPTVAVLAAHVDGAIYKGLALATTSFGSFLLAADFHNARIDVFDGQFRRIPLPPQFFFHDPKLPQGYAPFNVLVSGDKVYVAYAKQDADRKDEVAGAGLGFVDVYTNFGLTVHRVASRGPLNAPWGLAFAPASFGEFAGDLLVGNFGDGRISAYDGDHFEGQLRGTNGSPIAIDGLWALLPGTASTGGTDSLWFSAGPDDEQHGLIGQLRPAS
jgi:uncharacterized protein (TIGR03118 family)